MKYLFLLLVAISGTLNAQLRFDTGNTHEGKYAAGSFLTLSGLALITYTDGPTQGIGAVWLAGGVANLASGEMISNFIDF